MLLLFDIGNTAATYGAYSKGRFQVFGSCLYIDIPKIASKWLKKGSSDDKIAVISSVVPKVTHKMTSFFRKKGVKTLIAGANLPVPMKHPYPKGQKPGIDRLVNLYGAYHLHRKQTLVIDFGTAITFDYVSSKGVFQGGMIIPGPELSFQSLIQRAAQLPKKARLPHSTHGFLGTNTLKCLESGILEGYGAMTDGLIERFQSRYGKKLKVIATGGFATHLKPYSRLLQKVSPEHSIKSLYLLYKNSL